MSQPVRKAIPAKTKSAPPVATKPKSTPAPVAEPVKAKTPPVKHPAPPVRRAAPAPPPPVVEPEPGYEETVEVEAVESQVEVEVADQNPAGNPEGGEPGSDDDDIVPTPKVALPPTIPTAHMALVTGFERKDFDSGSVAAVVHLLFEDNEKEDKLMVFLPGLFVTNFLDVVMDPESILPNDPGDKNRGVKSNQQLNQYLRNIASGDQDAVMQKLRNVAKDQGRTITSLGLQKPQDFDSWVEVMASILTGCRFIALCRPDRNAQDPQFANMLRVQQLVDPALLDDPKQKTIKPYDGKKGYVLAWE